MKRRDLHAVASIDPVRSGRSCVTVCKVEIRHAHLLVNVDGDIQRMTAAELAAEVGCRKCVQEWLERPDLEAKYLAAVVEAQVLTTPRY